MFRFESFGSGSSGNLYYIESDEGAILIDAGIGIRKMRKFFREYGINICNIKGILVTHNHMDHVRCLGILNQKDNISVYLTAKTLDGIKENPAITKKPMPEQTVIINKEEMFELAGMKIEAFEVPHDSKDNVGYFIQHKESELCVVTDCGECTDTIDSYIRKASYLILESNYDVDMLEQGPYPRNLKKRISNGLGHLSNIHAAKIVQRHQSHLKHIWLCHISEKNNTPARALNTMKDFLSKETVNNIEVLERTAPSKMFELE